MKTVKVNVYNYNELNDKAKEEAKEWLLQGITFDIEWDCLKDDAKEVGIGLNKWEYNRSLTAEFLINPIGCAELILKNHGEMCETYKTAQKFLKERTEKETYTDDEIEELERDFLHSLEEDYRIMADRQYEYIQSDEYIEEMMQINEYTFLENGKRF